MTDLSHKMDVLKESIESALKRQSEGQHLNIQKELRRLDDVLSGREEHRHRVQRNVLIIAGAAAAIGAILCHFKVHNKSGH